jgi:hypothetical protein
LHERFGWAGSAGRKAEVENISNWEGWDKSNRCGPQNLAENESLGNLRWGKMGGKTTGVLEAREVVGLRYTGLAGRWEAVSDSAIYLELPHWNFPEADF